MTGFIQSWPSQLPAESKSAETAPSTTNPQPSSSELYDPLEGTESDNEDDDSAPTSTVSCTATSSTDFTSSTGTGLYTVDTRPGMSVMRSLVPATSFSSVTEAFPRFPFAHPPPGSSAVPEPGQPRIPNPVSLVPGCLPLPPCVPAPTPSWLPPPPTSAHFLPVTVPPPVVTQLPPTTNCSPPPTTSTAVTAAETSKSVSTATSSKSEPSRRRFTEEKQEETVPDNLFGYKVSSVTSTLFRQLSTVHLLTCMFSFR